MRLIDADKLDVYEMRFRSALELQDYLSTQETISEKKVGDWIPVKMRPMNEKERAEWSEKLGYDIEYEDAVIFDCPMPEDGQEILVSYRKWMSMDKCEIDDGCYGLEGNGDWEDVIAWMPLPEPWRKE